MQRKLLDIAALLALVFSLCSFGQAAMPVLAQGTRTALDAVTPMVISYQGYVTVSGSPYNGSGYFKFAIVDTGGTTSYWSNDGSSTIGDEPTNAVELTVTNGLFSVLLGDAGMQPLDTAIFYSTNPYLRVWFSSDGLTFTQLAPDRRFSAVPYAFVAGEAASAATADLLDGLDSSDFAAAGHNHDADYVNDDQQEVGDLDIDAAGLSPDRISGTAWTMVTDGIGSGLDADLLDGLDSSAFAAAAHNHDADYVNDDQHEVGDLDIVSGGLSPDRITGTAWTMVTDGIGSGLDADLLDGLNSSDFASADHDHDSAYVNDNASEVGDADIPIWGISPNRINGTAWTMSSDGSGSGLDADLLDGLHAIAFAAAVHNHDSAYVNDNAGEVGDADIPVGGINPNRIFGTAWTSGNDGTGSTLDADLLDGLQAAAFAAAGHNHDTAYVNDDQHEVGDLDIVSGGLSPSRITGTAWTMVTDGIGSGLDADLLDGLDSSDFAATAHNHDDNYVNDNAGEVGDADIPVGGINPNRIVGTAWTSSNDGTGSTLDADQLDGQHASAFALLGHNHDIAYVNDDAGEVGNADVTAGALNPDRITGTAWTMVTDGIGSGLDADLFDGQDSSYYQRRVTEMCPDGYAVLGVLADGTVTCEPVQARPGFSLTTLDSSGIIGWYTSIAIGADGLGLISYRNHTNGDLKVAHCSDTACTSATSYTLDSTGDVGDYTSITVGADGLGLISYHDWTNNNLKVAHCNNTACTSANTYTLDGTSENVGDSTSITIGADGLGLISYYDSTNSDLKVAHCSDTACTTAIITTLDSSGMVGAYTSIAIGADGLGLITYLDITNANLKVAHCNDLICSSAVITTLDSSGYVGWHVSITIGADGLGLISYMDYSNYDLKVAHCADTICTTATTTTLDSGGNVGSYTSITIGTDGQGLISYFDDTNHDLKIAHCNNPTCSSATTYTLDGASDFVGEFTSITIGTDGFGLISYYDNINSDLKVAHLSNTLGTPWTRRR